MSTEFKYSREWTDPEAFPHLWFTRSWENPEDYPTIETDETKVRQDMQSLHDEVKDFLNNDLIPRVVAEDATVDAWNAMEQARQEAETSRVNAENARAEAEQARSAAEQARSQSETTRQNAESARQTAESGRQTEEQIRKASEEARVAAENLRITDETERRTSEQTRKTAEQARVTAESGRDAAEKNRASAESSRVQAENARATAEQNRATKETSRVKAESARSSAEATRVAQENARATAENARVTAEKQRANAESARVRAEQAREDQETGYVAQARAHAQSAANASTTADARAVDATRSAQDSASSAAASANSAQNSANSATASANSASSAASSADAARLSAESVNADEISSRIAAKGDNLEFDPETSLLWLTSGGERIGDGITVATSGGGGGGGGESNNAVLSLSNTTGWIYKTISEGAPVNISFNWSSLEDGMETGAGVLKISVNGTVKRTEQIAQGEHTKEITDLLSSGSNSVKVNITDVYGNSRSLSFNLTVVSLVLESTFDSSVAYTGAINFPYVPTAAVEKTVHIKVDNTELPTATVTTSGRQQTYVIPAQSHGAHKIEAWFTAVVGTENVESNHLYYTVICTEAGNMTPIIAVDWRRSEVEQFEILAIPYIVYDPASLTATVNLRSSEIEDATSLTVDRTRQVWSYRVENSGDLTLTLSCAGADTSDGTPPMAVVSIGLTATETTLDVNAETNDLSLYLTSYGRSNNEENPTEWKYGDIYASLTGFNFTSDGWMEDEDGITVLRVGGDARVEIPVQMFAQDFRTTGKTIEIEFASRSVLDYDAVLATCWSGDRGFEITAQQAQLKSEQSEVVTRYKEDDHLRLSFVIEKRSGNRLIIGYINGIISGMLQYPDDDDFSQTVPVSISMGSNDCTIDIYNIRVYENDLNRFQMLDNWIADTQDLGDKKDRYDRNDIFDDYGQILPSTLRPQQCYLTIKCPVLPTYKGDKKTCTGEYVDPVHPERSFTFSGAEIDVQGTSSQYYYVKNFKIKFKGGFQQNGKSLEKYAMNTDAIPTNEFTFKADVASSEGANNVVLAEMYNDLCPVKTPAQEADPRVRQTIEGHPIVVFHDAGSGAKFIGKYNFNNDKGTAEVFGFKTGDESWEILENGNALVSFKTDDFTGWETSFEARYPAKNKNISRLQQFVSWVASTNTDGLTGSEREAKLNKFKTEITNWCDVDDAIFYYLFTLIFLCIDQREKNAFPTYNAEMAKWIWLFYDADSSIGTDNKGNLTFDYWMEDIDFTEAGDPVFNGQNNVFWTNLRECFSDEIRDEYRRLRTEIGADGKALLSYDKVNELFEAHQSQWSEAIFNEDAWRKAVEPLEKTGDTQYLAMQQGKKEQHFKHWMYNRFRYLDSKFETGAALDEENRIMMRAHAQGNIFLTSYINMYGQVYFNAERAEHRMIRDQEYEFEWSAQGAEDAVIGVNSAPMITSLGDLSPLKLEYAHIQYAKHLTELKIGDTSAVNDNFVELTLGNNTLLRKLDVRNCTSLTQSVDASGCTNIEEVYFDGTAITGLSLPNGGIVKKLHLPGTMTNLTLRNQTKLEEFVMPSYANVSTLRLENVPSVVDGWTILHQIPANSRVRMIGFDWTQDSAEAVLDLYDYLDTMRGLDENGNNVDKAQMSGTIRIDSLTGAQLSEMQSRYPSIKVVYQHITSYLYFYDDTGTTLLYTAAVADGGDGVYGGSTPTKASDAQYTYTFAGWSKTPGGSADSTALKAVAADRKVYAAYSKTLRTYTVYWKNGSTTLETDTNVPYGTVPTYNGSTPVYTGTDAEDYEFSGWSPAVGAITGNTTYTAQFRYTGYMYIGLLEKTISGDYVNDEVTSVAAYAFNGCDQLSSVRLPNATTIGEKAFVGMYRLTKLDLGAATSIAGDAAFDGCTKLATMILRSPTLCTLSGKLVYNPIPLTNGTGYIYVPAALVDSYKTANYWSTYANQFRAIEDYPEVWDPYSWESVNLHIEQGDYATFYKIGDEIPLDLGAEGKVNMQVAAFDMDDLADGTGKAPITFIAKELLKTQKRMNPDRAGSSGAYTEGTGAIGGWEKCEMRTYLQDTIKPLIPTTVANIIKVVNKSQTAADTTGADVNQTTNDDVWIPASAELGGTGTKYGTLFPTYKSCCTKALAGGSAIKPWWLRDTKSPGSTFVSANKSYAGFTTNNACYAAMGVALSFCVGAATTTTSEEG